MKAACSNSGATTWRGTPNANPEGHSLADRSNHLRAVEIERRVLQTLCQQGLDDSRRETALRLLSNYRWCEPTHGVIFDCVTRAPRGANATLRDYLVRCTTRKWFPDINWEQLFEAASSSNSAAENLMKELHDLE